MVVRLLPHDFEHDTAQNGDVHVVTFAEAGFSMLDIYMRLQGGCTVDEVHQFADEVNRRDESGSVVPRVNLSAVPRHCIRERAGTPGDEALLAMHVEQVLVANRDSARLQHRKLLFDFRAPGVESWMLQGAFRALLAHRDPILEEVGLISPTR